MNTLLYTYVLNEKKEKERPSKWKRGRKVGDRRVGDKCNDGKRRVLARSRASEIARGLYLHIFMPTPKHPHAHAKRRAAANLRGLTNQERYMACHAQE